MRDTELYERLLGKKELAVSGHLRLCHGDYGGGSPSQGQERADRNGGGAVG